MKLWVPSALLTLLVFAAAAQSILAQRFCYAIRPGDTAAQLAERLTGDPAHRRAVWFQIVDQHWRPVPKADYDVIHPGWLACLATVPPRRQATPSTGPHMQSTSTDVGFLWVGSGVLGGLWMSRIAVRFSRKQRERSCIMRQFGTEFVREFGRPLTRVRDAGPPPRARLRVNPRRSRVDVLIAPCDSRSYPNLTDHRRNVEYDVSRVMAALGRNAFATGQPYAEGRWVVLPFHYKGQ
jgi:hypothetical protein